MLNLVLVEVWVKITVIAAIVLIFFIITVLNIKTKKPADCIDEDSKCNTNNIQGAVVFHSKVLGFVILYLLKPLK